jgi:hypothetical protein
VVPRILLAFYTWFDILQQPIHLYSVSETLRCTVHPTIAFNKHIEEIHNQLHAKFSPNKQHA